MSESPTPIAIAVVQSAGKYLVGIRPAGVALAGLAEFPGGKVQARETPAEAAARECLEETGITVEVLRCRQELTFDYPHGSLRLHFFDCRPIDANVLPKPPFRWAPRAELVTLEFPAANAEIVMVLLAETKK